MSPVAMPGWFSRLPKQAAGPDQPGRYVAMVDGEPVGLTAWMRDGLLVWTWDDLPEDYETAWNLDWPCARLAGVAEERGAA